VTHVNKITLGVVAEFSLLFNEFILLESQVLEAEMVHAMQLITQRATNYLENPTLMLEDSGPDPTMIW